MSTVTFLRTVKVSGTVIALVPRDTTWFAAAKVILHDVTFSSASGPESQGTSVKQKANAARSVHVVDVKAQ